MRGVWEGGFGWRAMGVRMAYMTCVMISGVFGRFGKLGFRICDGNGIICWRESCHGKAIDFFLKQACIYTAHTHYGIVRLQFPAARP